MQWRKKKSISALQRVEPNSKLKFMNLAGNRTAKPHAVADQSFNVNKAKIMVNPSATHILGRK